MEHHLSAIGQVSMCRVCVGEWIGGGVVHGRWGVPGHRIRWRSRRRAMQSIKTSTKRTSRKKNPRWRVVRFLIFRIDCNKIVQELTFLIPRFCKFDKPPCFLSRTISVLNLFCASLHSSARAFLISQIALVFVLQGDIRRAMQPDTQIPLHSWLCSIAIEGLITHSWYHAVLH